MSGPPRSWLLFICLIQACGGLMACGKMDELAVAERSAQQLSAEAAQAEAEAALLAAYQPSTVDVSGCWRPVGQDNVTSLGAEFSLHEVGYNAYLFSTSLTNPRTKLLFNETRSFEEVNFSEEKPFFPPGYLHSTGSVSADNNTIERRIIGDVSPHIYRRCHLVRNRDLTQIPGAPAQAPQAEDAPQPIPQVTPLVPVNSDSSEDQPLQPLQPNPADSASEPIPAEETEPTTEPAAVQPTPVPRVRVPFPVGLPQPSPSASSQEPAESDNTDT